MSGKTDGRRAYDAWWAAAEGVPRHPDVTYDQDADAWEAAAQAAIEAAPPAIIKFDGKLSEADVAELREKFAEAVRTERPRVLAEPGSERVAELVTEVNELRALLGEILADCPGCGYWHGPPTGRDQVARWRERAGLTNMPAVVTAGTEHLAEKIRGLAIPDEEN